MNERIKELAIKVAGDYSKDDHWSFFNEELEKFAELIVKECMTEIQKVKEIKAGNAGPVYNQGFEDGMFVAIRTIEEHFGVEE